MSNRGRIGRIKEIARALGTPNYETAKRFGFFGLSVQALIFRRMSPFLVFSMGKVGTSTVVYSMEKQIPDSPVYHLHTLCGERLNREEEIYRANFSQLGRIHDHLLHSLYVKKRMKNPKGNSKKWKIVTLVRDPVQRNISSFFQTLNLHDKELGFAARMMKGKDPSLVTDMMEYFVTNFDHSRPFKWFDAELKEYFGIDVLESGFPRNKGYGIFREGNADALVIRLEDLNHCAPEAFYEFAGCQKFILENKQVSGRKYYASIYKQFQKEAEFPEKFLDYIYGSRYAGTFYSDYEIEAFRKKWGKKA